MNPSDPVWVEVFRARSFSEAHAARLALEASGISVQLEGDPLQAYWGVMPVTREAAPRMLVEASQADAARKIIEQFEATAAQSTGAEYAAGNEVVHCLACGAIMDNSKPSCEACGWSYAATREA